jgi:hypothetical protein
MARDIVPTSKSSITWDPQQAREQVNVICDLVQKKVEATAGWYVAKKVAPSMTSRTLRGVAILLSVLGGLCPIFQSALGEKANNVFGISLNNWGYILLALAAAAVLIDKYGGFSTTWMRFIGTHLKLDSKLHQFQIDWVIACAQYDLDPNKTPEKLLALLERLRVFVADCSTLVEEETQLWMSEFQSQLAMMQKATEKQQKAITGESGGTGDGTSAGAQTQKQGSQTTAVGATTLSVTGSADGAGGTVVNPTPTETKKTEEPAATADAQQ